MIKIMLDHFSICNYSAPQMVSKIHAFLEATIL